ncbi:hypothetical protein [Persicobacter diffluens]|uniref:Phosphate ABC transporter substrate-binding protein n=1 Tax=Persicobacter diffluens TaxID=981 RepID=A0AAN4W2S0_9BACT|nr:hypothetical protein PEDI_37490 [Persicobacter diffluens]
MKNIQYFICFGFVLFLTGVLAPTSLKAQEMVIIVNANNPVDQMEAGNVRLYWLRRIKKRWPQNNKYIRPTDFQSSNVYQDAFYEKILKMNAEKVEKYFMSRQYQNAEKPQDKFGSSEEIIEFIESTEGAIGFVDAKKVANNSKVKVVYKLTL